MHCSLIASYELLRQEKHTEHGRYVCASMSSCALRVYLEAEGWDPTPGDHLMEMC